MKNTKLVEALRSFSKDEFKLFEKFVASPFFNNGRNYSRLVNELEKFYPDFENEKLTNEFIYKKIYPGRKFNKQVMWNQISQLEKLAIEFIMQLSLKEKKLERFTILYDKLSDKNVDRLTLKEIESADKYFDSVKFGKEHFFGKWNVENNKADYWNTIHGRQDKCLEGILNCSEYLLLNFLVDLSTQAWDLHILKIMYNAGEEIQNSIDKIKSLNLKEYVELANRTNNKYSQIINFYYNKLMCALDENEESYFFEMKKFFDGNYNLFDFREQSNTIISLANYCAHKMRLGDKKFLKVLFDINKFRLEKEIGAFDNGKINKALYHQILRNALSLGETKWAENFVKEYTPRLRRQHQKTMNALAQGYISYAKKEYDVSLHHLNKVEFIDVRDKLHVRILSAKAYYELNDSELLFYYIDSSKHFIGNNSAIEKETKEAYLKFFNFLIKLLNCKQNPDASKIKEFKEDLFVDNVLRLRHKNWLLEKANEL